MFSEFFSMFLSASWPFILLGAGIRWWFRKEPRPQTFTLLTFLAPALGLLGILPGGPTGRTHGISDGFFLLLCGLPVGAVLCGIVLRAYEAIRERMENDHL